MDPSGLYIHTVDIEKPTRAPGDYLTPVVTWTRVVRRLHCRIRPLTSFEEIRAAQTTETTTHKMYCDPKRLSGVDATCRVVFGSRYLSITGIRDVDEAGIRAVLRLEEIDQNGI